MLSVEKKIDLNPAIRKMLFKTLKTKHLMHGMMVMMIFWLWRTFRCHFEMYSLLLKQSWKIIANSSVLKTSKMPSKVRMHL